MKKLLALLLALACMMSFVACGDDKDKGKDKDDKKVEEKVEEKKSDEDLARETAEGYMDAFMELDTDGMLSYLDDPSVMEDAFSMLDKDALAEQLPAEMSAYEKQYMDILDILFDKASSEMSYKIKDTEKDGDSYVFTVEADVVTEDMFESLDGTAVAQSLMDSGAITEDMSQDEVLEIYFDEMGKVIKDADIETQTGTCTIVVYEKDGEWVINTEESDL